MSGSENRYTAGPPSDTIHYTPWMKGSKGAGRAQLNRLVNPPIAVPLLGDCHHEIKLHCVENPLNNCDLEPTPSDLSNLYYIQLIRH